MTHRVPLGVIVLLLASACSASPSASSTPSSADALRVEFTGVDGLVTVSASDGVSEVTVVPVDDPGALGLGDDAIAFEFEHQGTVSDAVVTVRSGPAPTGPLPMSIGLVADGSGGWTPVRTAAVTTVGDDITLAFSLPRLDTLAIVPGPVAVRLDPSFGFGVVGEHWTAWWELVESGLPFGATGPLVRSHLQTIDPDGVPTVRGRLDGIEVVVEARADGAVAPVPGGVSEPSHRLEPLLDFQPGGSAVAEVFGGPLEFTCLAPGAGYHAASVTLVGPASRFGVPGDDAEVSIHYDVAAPVTCSDRGPVLVARYLRDHLGLSGETISHLVASLEIDDADEDPIGVDPAGDLLAFGGFRLGLDSPILLGVDAEEFPCGETRTSPVLDELAVTVVCGTGPITGPGSFVVVAASTAAAETSESSGTRRLVAVFDSAGGDSNDASDRADTRYEVRHDDRWTLAVRSEDGALASSARVVIVGNVVLWFIPADELSFDEPRYSVMVESDAGDRGDGGGPYAVVGVG